MAYGDNSLILSRLDVHIMHNLMPMLGATSAVLRLALLRSQKIIILSCVNIIIMIILSRRTFDLIGKALHASRLPDGKQNFVLQQRDAMVDGLLAIVSDSKGGSGDSKKKAPSYSLEQKTLLQTLSLVALGSLSTLEPPLSGDMRDKCTTSLFTFFDTQPEHLSKEVLEKDGQRVEKDGVPLPPVDIILHLVNAFFTSLIHMEPTVGSLTRLLEKVEIHCCHATQSRSADSFFVLFCFLCIQNRIDGCVCVAANPLISPSPSSHPHSQHKI